ncbi:MULTISPECIES: PhzF family phenazine biosynthesis protein [unclassified Paenibacillus]|uniref:PhzF family phenazine biosynthesis protein n=1 Tax=unclassified Paenibacillus TaxID=185978 RepID=UPI0030CE4724
MRYYVVDAFAEKVFEGNPAGVCILEEWLPEATMQSIATENNLSETAFAVKEGEDYRLRWFTPAAEIELCGHGTLSTAFILAQFYEPNSNRFVFHTLSGILTVLKKQNLFELDFPNRLPESFALTQDMVDALGVTPIETYLGRDLMFLLENEDQVRQLTPDFSKLKQLPDGLGVNVTSQGSQFDFVSRSFFPKLNVNEDPVCGSAHCNLIPFWAGRLGKNELVARQASPRGGTLYCRLEGDRVVMGGTAVLYATSELHLDHL